MTFPEPRLYAVTLDDLARVRPARIPPGPPPPAGSVWLAAATVRLIDLVAGEHGERRREQLRLITRHAREMLQQADFELVSHSETPILAIPLRNARRGAEVLEFLRGEGFVVSVFQGPLMPIGQEVLRLAMRADLEPEEVERLVQALARCRDALRFTSPAGG